MAISESKSQMLTCTPVPCNAGKTTRYMSSICMQTIHPATMQSWCGCCLIERNSKIGEGQQPFPQDLIMLEGNDVLQVTGLAQSRDHQHKERNRAARCACEDVH